MKTKHFLLAALAAIVLASCSSDDFVGSENSPDKMQNNVIGFGGGFKAITRANEHVGADAANLLNKHFTVSGYKVTGTTPSQVFYDYVVNWEQNTAGTTESNTNDWEYVGYNIARPSTLFISDETSVKQTIKYWDFSTDYYDFIAYSTGEAEVNGYKVSEKNLGDNELRVSAIDWTNRNTKAYTIGGSRLNLAKAYIADLVKVKKADYQQVVTLQFRSLASKVRMAIYETVPGYSVKDVKFYTDERTSISTGASETEANLFTTGSENKDKFHNYGTYTIYFPNTDDESDPDYNQAHVSFKPVAGNSVTTQRFGTLQTTTAEAQETGGSIWLGRNLNEASYAANKDYKIMLPNPEGTVLELRIDYTLVSTDGSGEEIKVYGAKAFVPATYTQWLPNYAYTYIFKISDNTNGWTSNLVDEDGNPTDPAGLYPITFDAVVIDAEEGKQSTVTTVATPSITTYQKGHDMTKDEYAAAQGDIYIQVMKDGTLVKVNETDHPVQAWEVTKEADNNIVISEATVMDALNIRAKYTSKYTTGRNGLTLTKLDTSTDVTAIPGVDGNDIKVNDGEAAKFTPTKAGTYVVTYKDTDNADKTIYTAVALTEEPSDWATAWYEDPEGKTKVGTFAEGTYYQKYTNRNIDWGAKVIKVVD